MKVKKTTCSTLIKMDSEGWVKIILEISLRENKSFCKILYDNMYYHDISLKTVQKLIMVSDLYDIVNECDVVTYKRSFLDFEEGLVL